MLFIVGYGIGYMTGNVTDEGFNLQGAPAFIAFAIIVLYFIVFTRYLGGTLFSACWACADDRSSEASSAYFLSHFPIRSTASCISAAEPA